MPEHIEQQALKLSRKERVDLVVKLLRSLESDPEAPDAMDEWIKESEKRLQAYKQGEIESYSEEEALQWIEQRRTDQD